MTPAEIRKQRKLCLHDMIKNEFVLGFLQKPEQIEVTSEGCKVSYIKLRDIKSIEFLWQLEKHNTDGCIFYLSNETKYFTYLTADTLVRAVNEVLRF